MARMVPSDFKPTGRKHDSLMANPALRRLHVMQLLANADEAMFEFCEMSNALRHRGTLDPVLREVAILRLGNHVQCRYEVVYHERMIVALGLDSRLVPQIYSYPDAPGLNDMQKAVIRFTDECLTNYRPGDEIFEYVKARLSTRDLHELVLNIGFYMMASTYFKSFDLEVEPDFEQIMKESYQAATDAMKGQTS